MKTKLFSLICFILAAFSLNAKTVTVKFAAPLAGITNYNTISAALNDCKTPGDVVWVSVGSYNEDSIVISTGVKVIGGFPTANTVNEQSRIFPGRLGVSNAERTVLNGQGMHRVATVSGTLDGCLILNGKSNDFGGGVLVKSGGSVQNCIIRGNQCHNLVNGGVGGGAYMLSGSKLVNCIVDFNMAQQGFGVAGAGDVINCTITNNCNAPFWAEIPAGSFTYTYCSDGSPKNDITNLTEIKKSYYISQTECTVAQFAVFANATQVPISRAKQFTSKEYENCNFTAAEQTGLVTLFKTSTTAIAPLSNYLWAANTSAENLPMQSVTWYGALAFSQWIGGDLPTEKEWEYAARKTISEVSADLYAGTSSNPSNFAWFGNSTTLPDGNALAPQVVATKKCTNLNLNEFGGLFDMSGNVQEFCKSWYEPTILDDNLATSSTGCRVVRGGSWKSMKDVTSQIVFSDLKVAKRNSLSPSTADNCTGFRPVLRIK